jgi:hypothetical protein
MAVPEGVEVYLSDLERSDDPVPLSAGGEFEAQSEPVFHADGDCGIGAPAGEARYTKLKTGPEKLLVDGALTFNDEDSLSVKGPAKRKDHNGKESFEGVLAITGGTGRYKGWKGQVFVDHCNPKRWRVDGGP